VLFTSASSSSIFISYLTTPPELLSWHSIGSKVIANSEFSRGHSLFKAVSQNLSGRTQKNLEQVSSGARTTERYTQQPLHCGGPLGAAALSTQPRHVSSELCWPVSLMLGSAPFEIRRKWTWNWKRYTSLGIPYKQTLQYHDVAIGSVAIFCRCCVVEVRGNGGMTTWSETGGMALSSEEFLSG
jgi:hypothetical protein